MRGPHVIYVSCSCRPLFFPLFHPCSSRAAAAPSLADPAPPPFTQPLAHDLARARLHTAPPPPRVFHTARSRRRAQPAPPLRSRACAATRRLSAAATVCLHAVVRVRAAVPAPHAAHAAAPFAAAAAAAPSRSVLAGCSTFCPSHFLRCFRAAFAFPHTRATASRDGSREEEGEGSCCGEARPQADSRREREAERAEMVAKAAEE